MKKKYLLLPALIATTLSSAWAQDRHPALETAASKIDTKAEFVLLNKLSGDLSAITQYLELILDAARNSGEKIPPNLKAKDLMEILGVNTLQATGNSSTKQDNAWVNRSYLENGGSDKGIFSLFGEKGQAQVASTICPAGTDLALQLQLDLRQVESIVTAIAKAVGEGDKINENMKKPIPNLGMTSSEVLAKLNVRANLMLDLDSADTIPTPFGEVGRPFVAARIDGIAWLWEKIGKKALTESDAPIDVTEKDGMIILKPNAEALAEMDKGEAAAVKAIMKLSPIAIIDIAKNQIWLGTNEDYLSKCMSGQNTLADSPEFKAAMEGLPEKANSMAYVSKHLLSQIAEKYTKLGDSGMLGKDFEKAKPLVDHLLEDITESDKGWAMTMGKDDNGVLFTNRGPFASKHMQYLSGLVPYMMMQGKNSQGMKAIKRSIR